jgi:hypothetical protein
VGFTSIYYRTRWGPDKKASGLPNIVFSACPLWLSEYMARYGWTGTLDRSRDHRACPARDVITVKRHCDQASLIPERHADPDRGARLGRRGAGGPRAKYIVRVPLYEVATCSPVNDVLRSCRTSSDPATLC